MGKLRPREGANFCRLSGQDQVLYLWPPWELLGGLSPDLPLSALPPQTLSVPRGHWCLCSPQKDGLLASHPSHVPAVSGDVHFHPCQAGGFLSLIFTASLTPRPPCEDSASPCHPPTYHPGGFKGSTNAIWDLAVLSGSLSIMTS